MILSAVHPHVFLMLSGIYGILVFATFYTWALAKLRPQRDCTELKKRIHSWWIIITLFGVTILASRTLSIAFFAFVSFLALKEFYHLSANNPANRRVALWAFLAIPLQYYWVYTSWYNMFIIFVPVYLFLIIPMRLMLIGETHDFLKNAGIYHWGLMSTVYCLGHLSFFHAFSNDLNPNGGAAGFILFAVFLTEFNDVSQYVWGKMLGRRKIVPRVSPNKTWEGFLGGVVTTVTVTWFLAPYLTPIHGWHSIFAGLIFSVGGFVGDVVVSAVKRDIGTKDSGSLIPGHGGILDRVDSLLFTGPLFFHFVKYFYF